MPLVTALYACILTLLILGLGYYVTRVRHAEKISLGVGESALMERAVRIHANAVENVPLALLLLVMLELQGARSLWIHGLGVALVFARLLHAQGLLASPTTSFGRFWGTALTWTAMGTSAVLNGVLSLGLLETI